MKSTLLLAALFILVLGGGYLWKGGASTTSPSTYRGGIISSSTFTTVSATTTTVATPGKSISTSNTVATQRTYTQTQVATHSTSSSCWAIINRNVYDLTAWIAQHPGGEGPILSLCGKDGTSVFENQHGNNGRANSELATLKIGVLAQ